ncbi:LysE family translocator [Nocardia sp. NPDC055002]|uniref:LysE family translocator n=1 Tax=Nocardia sp. NPDC056952 TaxID=3345979 RepID=UPI003641FC7F
MLSLEQLVTFGVAALIIIVIPGPSVVFAIGRALAHGRSVALASVAGNTLGLLTVLALVSVGLGAIVAESATVFWIVKIAGAAYLVYLGVNAIRHRAAFGAGDLDPERSALPWRTSVRQGFVVGASNPKSFILAAAVVPQFVDRGAGQVQLQILLLGLIAVAIALVSDSLWAVLAARLRDWFSRSPRREETLGTVGGLSMIGLGVSVAFTGNHAK